MVHVITPPTKFLQTRSRNERLAEKDKMQVSLFKSVSRTPNELMGH